MEVTTLTRVYRYDGIDLPVPPHLAGDAAALRAYHSTLYPAILNAEAVDAGVSGGVLVTEYRRAVGTKGGLGSKRILSDAQIDEMIELRERGWSATRIAAHFTEQGTPISAGSIGWQCLRVGADAPPRLQGANTQATKPYLRNGRVVKPFSPEDDTLLKVLDMQGFNISVIARRMNRGANSIRGRLYTLARRDARAEQAAGINA